jgi:uncharacterized protein (TIGR04255 family)
MAHEFPEFEHPPIVETALGVQFAPLQGLTGAHMGKFWTELGSDWVKVIETQPISDQFESFNTPAQFVPLGTVITSITLPRGPRLQIFNQSNDRMIQVQSNRFHYNWQKAGEKYPSYRKVREEFDAMFARFTAFVAHAGLGEPIPNQWELTYIDFFPAGELWNSPKEWARLLPGLFGTFGGTDHVRLETFTGEWHYEIAPQRGRLHIAPTLGKVTASNKEGLALQMTARGPISKESPLDLGQGLDLAHEIIVQTFLDITSAEAQKAWGRKG